MKEKFNNDIIKLASLLKNYCEEFENKKYRIIDNRGEIYNSPFLFFYTFLLKKDFRKNKYINLLKNYLEKSERFFPGSSFYLCVMFYNFVFKNKKFNKIQKKEKLNKKNIENFFLQFYSKEKLDIFLEIIKFSGPDSTIITKTSKNSFINCIKKEEVNFNFKVPKNIESIYFAEKSLIHKNLNIVALDSFIERESDLNPAIEKSFLDKRSLLVICRGISDIALQNLKTIMLRKNILIYVYTSKFNPEDPFEFKDFCKLLNINYLTPDKGSIIVRDIEDSIVPSEKVYLKRNSIVVQDSNEDLLQEIRNQIKNCKEKDLKVYLEKRKKRLSLKKTEVLVPENKKFFLQDLKDFINCYNSVLKYGLIKDKNLYYSFFSYNNNINLLESFNKNLTNIGLVIKEQE